MTRNDIITAAMRRLGIVAADETITADQSAYGGDVLEGLIAEIGDEAGAALTWDLDTAPAKSGRLLANLLAVEIAPQYSVAPPEPRGIAWLRLMGSIRPDDRQDIAEPEYF